MSSVLIIAVLWAAVAGGMLALLTRKERPRLPVVTFLMAGIITVVSVVGELVPSVLALLGRDTGKVLDRKSVV